MTRERHGSWSLIKRWPAACGRISRLWKAVAVRRRGKPVAGDGGRRRRHPAFRAGSGAAARGVRLSPAEGCSARSRRVERGPVDAPSLHGFTDEAHKRLLRERDASVIYFWSPHMSLSAAVNHAIAAATARGWGWHWWLCWTRERMTLTRGPRRGGRDSTRGARADAVARADFPRPGAARRLDSDFTKGELVGQVLPGFQGATGYDELSSATCRRDREHPRDRGSRPR
jgi:hypothetical protein